MGMTTMGVKLDDATRERIKTAATRIDRTPHWLIKQAIFNYLERLESDEGLPELPALLAGAANESEEAPAAGDENHQPFLEFAEQILPQSVSRAAITGAYRRAETDAVPMLLEQGKTLVEGMPQALAWRQTLNEDDDALMLEMSAEATRNPLVANMLIEAEARMFANA